MSDSTTMLSSMIIPLTANSSYTYFEIPLTYNLLPVADTVNIFFAANNMDNSTTIGSVLFIDSLNISYFLLPVEIQTVNNNSEYAISIYPNPVQDILNVPAQSKEEKFIQIYDAIGEIVKESSINKNCINISNLLNGLYLYKITDKNGNLLGAGKFMKK